LSALRNGGLWSDTHGTFEHHQADGASREAICPGDRETQWYVAQHHFKIFECRHDRAAFHDAERQGKLDPFAEQLAGWLTTEAGKSRKQRRTLKQLHADLVVLGFNGSYGRVAAFARGWRADRQREQQTTGRGTFVPLLFRPGEAFRNRAIGTACLTLWQ
jgi:hypothetical protein